MSDIILSIEKVTKKYGEIKALSNFSLELKKGECVSLIGPNGSGKTTLLRAIVGLTDVDKGKIVLLDKRISTSSPVNAHIGYVADEPPYYDYLSGVELLEYTAALHGLDSNTTKSQINKAVNIFPIKEILNNPISTYSRGNKQKLAFLCANLHRPDLIVIDEPIVGLDIRSIAILTQQINHLKKQGISVLIATHITDFASKVSDRVVLLNKGKSIKTTTRVDANSLEKLYFAHE